MNFEIKLHPDAVKFLVDKNPETKERLKLGIKSLEIDIFKSRSQSDIKKLKGTKKRKGGSTELYLQKAFYFAFLFFRTGPR